MNIYEVNKATEMFTWRDISTISLIELCAEPVWVSIYEYLTKVAFPRVIAAFVFQMTMSIMIFVTMIMKTVIIVS